MSKETSHGEQFFDLQRALSERQDARFGVEIALEDVFDDGHQARMDREEQTGAGRLQRLGDVPGKTHVVADAGDEGDFAGEVQRNHKSFSRRQESGVRTEN